MDSEVELRSAALSLHRELLGRPWLASVGMTDENGVPALVLYLSRRVPGNVQRELPATWQNFPVRVKEIGRVRPAPRRKLATT